MMKAERGTMNERQLLFSSSFIVPPSSFLFYLHLKLCAAAVGELGQANCEQAVFQLGGRAAHAHGPAQRDGALETTEVALGTMMGQRAARAAAPLLPRQPQGRAR